MSSLRKKLQALFQFAGMFRGDPGLMALAGFLAGRLDQVFFTDDAEGERVSIRLYTPGVRILPAAPVQAMVDGSLMPDPLTFIAAVAQRTDPIAVKVDFPPGGTPDWYAELLEEDAGAPGAEGFSDEARLEEVRQRLDTALDIYNECRKMLAQGAPEREKELQFMLRLARSEMEALGQEINRLKSQLDAM